MKRILSSLLTFIMVIGICTSMPFAGVKASAVNGFELFTVKKESVEDGVITYNVYLNAEKCMNGAIVYAKFDSDVLEVDTFESGAYMIDDGYGGEKERLPGIYEADYMYGYYDQYSIAFFYNQDKDYRAGSSSVPFMTFTFNVIDEYCFESFVEFYCYEFQSVSAPQNNIENGEECFITSLYAIHVHTFSEYKVVDIEPTCTESGWESNHCIECGEKNNITEIPATGHTFLPGMIVDVEPTCTEPGWKSNHCIECGEKTDITEIPATGHTFFNGLCTVCGVSEIVPVLEVGNDTLIFYLGTKEYINATCSISGTEIEYTSLDTSVATVDENGYVTGEATGTTRIVVSAEDCESIEVKVVVVNPKLRKPKLSLSTSASGVKLYWGEVSGASSYEVWRASGSGSWSKLTTTKKTSFVDKNIYYGKTYKYRVKATGTSNGLKRSSEYAVTSKKISKLYKPKTFTVKSVGCKTIKLTWTRSYPAKGYEIYRATSKMGTYKKIKTISSGSTLSYTNRSLTTGKKYYYKIRTIYGSTKSSFTSVKSAVPKLSTPKLQASASATTSTITIRWGKVSGASGYAVYRKRISGTSWSRIATITSGSTTSYKNKKTSGLYCYAVKAYKKAGSKNVYSSLSKSIKVRTLKTPQINVKQYKNEFTDRITWEKESGANGYQVYMKKGENGSWSRVGTTSSTSYKKSVTHGVYYYWKVRAIYKNNGVTTYGPYSKVKDLVIGYSPSYSVFMPEEHYQDTGAIAMLVTNSGNATMRIYSKNAYYSDSVSSAYDRNLYLVDTIYETFEPVSYVDIKPGETVAIGFFVKGANTWYDPQSYVFFDFRYDGIYYRGASSAYYGNTYSQKY